MSRHLLSKNNYFKTQQKKMQLKIKIQKVCKMSLDSHNTIFISNSFVENEEPHKYVLATRLNSLSLFALYNNVIVNISYSF